MYFNCTYNRIRIRLTHRLVRKILRAFEKEIKENGYNSKNAWLIIENYNLFRRMRKHPNIGRFQHKAQSMKFYKKTVDRFMFINGRGRIRISFNNGYSIEHGTSHKIFYKNKNTFSQLMDFILKHKVEIPF